MLSTLTPISVIIPALNEGRFIGDCLTSLTKLTYPHCAWEVILVDNGSTDRTLEIANSFTSDLNIKIIQKATLRVSGLRNAGARLAKGDRLIFLDADCVVPPNWLETSINASARADAVLLGARFRLPSKTSWVARVWWEHDQRDREGGLSYLSCHNLHIRRADFLALGGFDESLETNEDYEFSQRVRAAGGELLDCPELSVVHLGNAETLRNFFRRERWHGRDVLRVLLRDIRKRHNLRAVAFASYTLVCLAMLLTTFVVGLIWGLWYPSIIALLATIAAPLALGLLAGMKIGHWQITPQLMLLFLLYGIARAVALVDAGNVSQRTRIKVATS